MKQQDVLKDIWLIVIWMIFFISSANAQQIIVINYYQEIPNKKAELTQIMKNEVINKFTTVKGLEWTKFFHNPTTGERGSVFLWKSQEDWEVYSKSDLRKELTGKMKPFLSDTISSKSYPVHE